MLSKSAFSVGRAMDTSQTSCGAGSEGIIVTGVSEVFSAKVENPVQYFLPFATVNKETDKVRVIPANQIQRLVQQIQPEDYFDEAPTFKQSYAPQSGEIFGILKQMLETFEKDLAESQKEEMANQKAYEDLKAAKDRLHLKGGMMA